MRLVLIGPIYPYRGGIAHYTTMLYHALQKKHEVFMVSFKRQYPKWFFPGRNEKDPSDKPLIVQEGLFWIDSINPVSWLTSFHRILKLRPEIIILQWWALYWAPLWNIIGILNRFTIRVPIVFICHNLIPHEAHWLNNCLTRYTLKWASKIIIQSENEAQKAHKLIPTMNIELVYHPVYEMFTEHKVSKHLARETLKLPRNSLVLLFFGFVRKYKNLEIAINAFAYLQKSIPNCHLVIAGEFWVKKDKYEKLIQDLDITKQVHIFDRYIPNEMVHLFFSAADVLIAPYYPNTNSGVIQIAKSFGLPVLPQNPSQNNSIEVLAKEIIEFFQSNNRKVISHSDDSFFRWEQVVRAITQ